MKHYVHKGLFLVAAFALQGCAGLIEEPRVEPPAPAVMVSPEVLDASVRSAEKLVEENLLDEADIHRADEFIAAIETFRTIPPGDSRKLGSGIEKILESASELVYLGLYRAESRPRDLSTDDTELRDLHRRMLSAYRAGDHKTVIDVASLVRENYGPDGLGPEITAVLALSLGAEGRFEEAVMEGTDASRRLEGLPDFMVLTADLARWHVERGNIRDAENLYKKLETLLSDRSIMLAGLERQLDRPLVEHESFKSWAADLRGSRPELGNVLDTLERAAKLVDDENFSEARDLLGRTRQWMEPGRPETAVIDEAMNRLEKAEEAHLQARIRLLARGDLNLQPISDLIARENYREALARLEAVERVSGSSPEISEIREAAVERLITRETTRAAEKFLAAGKTSDLRRKRSLLEETRSILAGLLSAYPGAPSAGRIQSYLDRVEVELDRTGSGPGTGERM